MQDLTAQQLGELRQSFDASDEDGDGWIADGEFALLLQALDHKLSYPECMLAFEATDRDGDGVISFEEFIQWWLAE
jgi:Ca2+-binding EF-hand superfamily protein